MNEVWREIEVLGRTYRVSNLGGITNADGSYKAKTPQRNGYELVNFCAPGRRRKAVRIHVLVAEAFIGPRPPGKMVRHLDDIKSHNNLSNLAYGTHKENSDDSRLNGTRAIGEVNGHSKLTNEAVVALRQLRGLMPQTVISEWLGVTQDIVSKAQRGETWKHAAGEMTTDEALKVIFMRALRNPAERRAA